MEMILPKKKKKIPENMVHPKIVRMKLVDLVRVHTETIHTHTKTES